MKHRKLRIAWSVAWGVVAVLMVPLWVRSYWIEDIVHWHLYMPNLAQASYEYEFACVSESGEVGMRVTKLPFWRCNHFCRTHHRRTLGSQFPDTPTLVS